VDEDAGWERGTAGVGKEPSGWERRMPG